MSYPEGGNKKGGLGYRGWGNPLTEGGGGNKKGGWVRGGNLGILRRQSGGGGTSVTGWKFDKNDSNVLCLIYGPGGERERRDRPEFFHILRRISAFYTHC